jgi:hypothetical protein
MDVSYVTSLAFYFLCMFALKGVFSLVLGQENEIDDTKLMAQQMTMGMGQPGQVDIKAVFLQERENLELTKVGDDHFLVPQAPGLLLEKYRAAATAQNPATKKNQ